MYINSINDLKAALRQGPYAWPGGYPLYFITSDGMTISFETARRFFRSIMWSIKNECDDGWRICELPSFAKW